MVNVQQQGTGYRVSVFGTGSRDTVVRARDAAEMLLAVGHAAEAPHKCSRACPFRRAEDARRAIVELQATAPR